MEVRELDAKKIENKKLLLCVMIVAIVLSLAYVLELVKGARTIVYLLVFLVLLWAPLVTAFVLFKQNSHSKAVRYVTGFGYLVFYAYVLLTASTALDFVYVIPCLIAIFIFQDYKYMLSMGLTVSVLVVVSVVVNLLKGNNSHTDIASYEIQVAAIVLVVVISLLICSAMEKIANNRVEIIDYEKETQKQMLSTIKESTGSIYKHITVVNEESSNISKGSHNSKIAIDQIVEGSNELAGIIANQLEMSSRITELTEAAAQITEQIQTKFAGTREITDDGNREMNLLASTAEEARVQNESVKESVLELVERADEAKGILTLISGITSQTTLLALNASIEAARAGEAGKGFAVVADEIKQLAADTLDATQKITAILEELEVKTKEASESMETLTEKNAAQIELVVKTKEIFDQIKDDIDSVSVEMNTQAEQMQEVSNANNMISSGIENISSFSQELTANVENTRGMTDDTLNGTERISDILEGITSEVQALQDIQN